MRAHFGSRFRATRHSISAMMLTKRSSAAMLSDDADEKLSAMMPPTRDDGLLAARTPG